MAVGRVLVVGGGVAGMQAALDLAGAGRRVTLVEKSPELGGHVGRYARLFPALEEGRVLVQRQSQELAGNPLVDILLGTEVKGLSRTEGGFRATMDPPNPAAGEVFDAVVLATGYDNFDAQRYGEYGYGRYPGVITGVEFETSGQDILTRPINTAVFIKCVGSRDRSKGMPYCSKICCLYTAKQALEVKLAVPEAQVYVFYMDIRANVRGGEEFVREVMEKHRVRYIRGRVAKVFPDRGRLVVRAEDTLMGVPLEMEADLVVLATAMVPSSGTPELAAQVGAESDEYGFVAPRAVGENTPMMISPGVFYAGACGFPADVRDSLTQGSAAAAGVIGYLRSKEDGV